MLRTVVDYPSEALRDGVHKRTLIDDIERSLVRHMHSLGYDGIRRYLTEKDVEVKLQPYDAVDVDVESLFFMKIMGFDYPNRMDNIQDQLENIADEIRNVILNYFSAGLPIDDAGQVTTGQKVISLVFVPIRKDCWVYAAE